MATGNENATAGLFGTQYPDLFGALASPFEPHEVKTRQQGGRDLCYITARTAMNRLDNVVGPENWHDDYATMEHGVICRLTIRFPDADAPGGWRSLTKVDAGGYAGMSDQGDDEKSGFADAFKRAAVKFGVGRYLYRDGVPGFAQTYHGDVTPQQAPRSEPRREPERRDGGYQGGNGGGDRQQGGYSGGGQSRGNGGPPRSGKALFAWTKDQETKYDVGLLKFLNQWAKLQEFPGRMVDWDAEQVRLAYEEATRKLAAVGAGSQAAPADDQGGY